MDDLYVEYDATSLHDPLDLAWAGGFIDAGVRRVL